MAPSPYIKKRSSIASLLFTRRGTDTGLLVLRAVASGMLMRHGLQKFHNFDSLSTSFSDPVGLGIKPSLVMIILVETGCSLLVMLGLLTRPAAAAIVFGMFVAAFVSHPGGFDMASSEMPLLYMLIFAAIFIAGPGRWSADDLIGRRLSARHGNRTV